MPIPPVEQARVADAAGQVIQKTSHIHFNLEQHFILTTEDKLRLCLMGYLGRVERKKGWIAPLGILVTIVVTCVTAQFQEFYLSAAEWKAVFIVAGFLAGGWLVKAIFVAFVSTSLDGVVKEIKKSAQDMERASDSRVNGGARIVTSRVGRDLVIQRAIYGARGVVADVADVLRQRISDGRIEMMVTNANLGGDPIRNVNKVLTVEYSVDGKPAEVKVPEGQVLLLPPPG